MTAAVRMSFATNEFPSGIFRCGCPLRSTRDLAITLAQQMKRPIILKLISKGVKYGSITGNPDGSVDASKVQGVDADLRVKPFFAEGSTISMREFIVGALHNEMGLEASADPDLLTASAGGRVVTPSGMVLDGSKDKISAPPAPDADNGNEIDPAIVDHLEFYLLNYFKPGHGQPSATADRGRKVFNRIGCASCHVTDLTINHDRRVADLERVSDPTRACAPPLQTCFFNSPFATGLPGAGGFSFGLCDSPRPSASRPRNSYSFGRHVLF